MTMLCYNNRHAASAFSIQPTTMQINVTLVGSLRDKLPKAAKGKTTVTLPDDATVADVIGQLGLSSTVSAAISGVAVDHSHHLQPGDELQLFRQLGGG
jgi:sulfur carrier protein ThiS